MQVNRHLCRSSVSRSVAQCQALLRQRSPIGDALPIILAHCEPTVKHPKATCCAPPIASDSNPGVALKVTGGSCPTVVATLFVVTFYVMFNVFYPTVIQHPSHMGATHASLNGIPMGAVYVVPGLVTPVAALFGDSGGLFVAVRREWRSADQKPWRRGRWARPLSQIDLQRDRLLCSPESTGRRPG